MNSCVGYKLGNNKPTHLQKVNSVSVPIFKNETLEPRLQTLVTNATIKAIQQSGTYQVSKQRDSDATLTATIRTISRRQLRSTRQNVLKTKEIEILENRKRLNSAAFSHNVTFEKFKIGT